jgi:hypothetical protein
MPKSVRKTRLSKLERNINEALNTIPDDVSLETLGSALEVTPWFCTVAPKGGKRKVSVSTFPNDSTGEVIVVDFEDTAKVREVAAALIAAADWMDGGR